MGNEAMRREIGKAIRVATGDDFVVRKCLAIGGGCINSTYSVGDDARRFFVKVNRMSCLAMFEAEADGLREIARTRVIRVPNPVCTGVAEGSAFLVLEFIDFSSGRTGSAPHNTAGGATIRSVPPPRSIHLPTTGRSSGGTGGSGASWRWQQATVTAAHCNARGSACWRGWMGFFPAMIRCRPCCIGICGAATTLTPLPVSRLFSIRRFTTVTGKRIWQ